MIHLIYEREVEKAYHHFNGITSNFLAAFVLLPEPTENALLLQVLYRSRPCYVTNNWLTVAMLLTYYYLAYRLLSHGDCYVMDCNYTSLFSLFSFWAFSNVVFTDKVIDCNKDKMQRQKVGPGMMGKAPLPKLHDQKEVIITMGRMKKENFLFQKILWIIFCLLS